MSEHNATIDWKLSGPDFKKNQYSREHTWSFDGGLTVPASSAPSVVPVPWSNAAHVDPEEAYVAAIASCHMLWWLSIAARQGYDVDYYHDEATGVMSKDAQGRLWISTITLQPLITYGARGATAAAEGRLHELAHEQCFLANSIKTRVIVQPKRPTD